MLLVTGISAVKLPWLDWVMEAYGLEAVQGMLVEGDGSRSIPSYPNFLLPAIREHVITQPFLETDGLLLLPNAHGIAKTGDVRGSVVREDLLVTSERAVLRRTTHTLEYDDTGGGGTGEGRNCRDRRTGKWRNCRDRRTGKWRNCRGGNSRTVPVP